MLCARGRDVCVYRCEYVWEHVGAVMHMYIYVEMWRSGVLLSLSALCFEIALH